MIACMFLVIDNYDSFVHNLARYFEVEGVKTKVVRNDALSIDDIEKLKPEAIVISPGPCSPTEAGISTQTVKHMGARTPILGVCLGHQAIGEAYGAETLRSDIPVHGKASLINHDGKVLFKDLPSPMSVGRYHSLQIKIPTGSDLRVTAQTEAGEIMAVQHRKHPVYGVQFHPESVLTVYGEEMVKNFIQVTSAWHESRKKAA